MLQKKRGKGSFATPKRKEKQDAEDKNSKGQSRAEGAAREDSKRPREKGYKSEDAD